MTHPYLKEKKISLHTTLGKPLSLLQLSIRNQGSLELETYLKKHLRWKNKVWKKSIKRTLQTEAEVVAEVGVGSRGKRGGNEHTCMECSWVQ